MKTIKTVVILLLCIGWIVATSYKYAPFNAPGALLTYGSGLLAVSNKEKKIQEFNSSYKPEIYVDQIGIPHIYSKNNQDAAFALGYMHAKDRYFQMEMMTRTVQGRLSEVYATKALKLDKFWKPYEFERKSKELLESYKISAPEFYASLLAYANGVNTYLQNNSNIDPLYAVFGEEPRAWKPEYSLLVTWYMSWSLSYFDHHIEQNEIFTKLDKQTAGYFYPLQPQGLKTILPSAVQPGEKKPDNNQREHTVSPEKFKGILAVRNSSNEELSPFQFHEGIGSNNWVVSGAKSKDGQSILANDPHLFLSLPEAFYEVQMASGKLNVYGFSIPGVPAIVSGHNDLISWGITNGEWDLVDRYLLKVKDDSLYYYDGQWLPFKSKKYTVKVKGVGTREWIERSTVHGKVIQEENGNYYAQYWYAEEKSNSAKAMYEMMQSKNWKEFKTALKDYAYPPQNFIYTDVANNIGIVCAGKLPERAVAYKGGLLDGTIKYQPAMLMDTLWSVYNPAKKFLFSANQQPVQNGVYFGAQSYADDYRVNRINNLLEAKDDWNSGDIRKMQFDNVDLSYEAFKTLLHKFKIPGERKELVDLLKNWDGSMEEGSNPAMIYECVRWSMETESQKFAQKYLKIDRGPSFKYFLKYLNDDHYAVPGSTTKQELFQHVLNRADSVLQKELGPDWKTKTYSNASSFVINNISFIPGLGQQITKVGGNTNTINMNTKKHHPVFRAVYEMKKGDIKGYTILSGGQSGKINSVHYKDQLQAWMNGEHKETQFASNPTRLKNITNTIIFK